MPLLLGLISDTHGLVRPEVFTALHGVDLILHAGDVGGDHVLVELGAIAPVHAVAGNVDPVGHPHLPWERRLDLDGVRFLIVHGHEQAPPTPVKLAARFDADVIVFGHTHRPVVERVGEMLVVNPGAAGPRRFHLQPTVARLAIADGLSARIVELGVR